MDIDGALKRMRQLAEQNADTEMAIVFEAIDVWLSTGGFKPAAWA